MEQKTSRRQFFKMAAVASGAMLLAPRILWAERRKAGGGGGGDLDLPLVEPGKGMAANLNYHNKNTDVKEAALKADRQGVKFADQKCEKCMLYTHVGKKGGADVGKCTLFANQLVHSTGWCASWAKKA